MIADRTGGRQVTVSIPDLISGEVSIDEDGNVYLLDQIDDGQGQVVERETFLMRVTRDGDLIYDHGRPQRIHPVEFVSGRVEVKDGKLELPGSRLKKPKITETHPGALRSIPRGGSMRIGPPRRSFERIKRS